MGTPSGLIEEVLDLDAGFEGSSVRNGAHEKRQCYSKSPGQMFEVRARCQRDLL